MTFEQISKDISNRKFSPIYLLAGDEPYFIDKISNQIVNSVLNEEEKEFNQNILYGLDTNALAVESEARKYPLMAEYNLVVIKEAQLLKDIDLLERYVDKPSASTILVLCYKKKPDKRKKIFKTLAKKSVVLSSNKLYESKIPEWIIKHVSMAGYHISIRNATLITDFLGNELAHISNELGKVILNIPQGTNITGEIIEEYIGVNKEYNSFELNNALGQKNVVKANRIINFFGQNEKKYPIQVVMGNLYSFFSKVLKMHYTKNIKSNELAGFLGIHPFFLKDYQQAAKKYSAQKLVDIISILHEYDLKSKGIGNLSIPNKELMKEMVYKILH